MPSYCPRSSLPAKVLAWLADRLAHLHPPRPPGQGGTPPLSLEVRLDAVGRWCWTGCRTGAPAGRSGSCKTEVGDGLDLPLGPLGTLGFCQPDGTCITTLDDLRELLGEMARSGEAVCVDGLATRVQRPRSWANQKVVYDAKRHTHTAQGLAVSTIWGDLLWVDGGWPGSCHEHELIALAGLEGVLDGVEVPSLLDRGFRGAGQDARALARAGRGPPHHSRSPWMVDSARPWAVWACRLASYSTFWLAHPRGRCTRVASPSTTTASPEAAISPSHWPSSSRVVMKVPSGRQNPNPANGPSSRSMLSPTSVLEIPTMRPARRYDSPSSSTAATASRRTSSDSGGVPPVLGGRHSSKGASRAASQAITSAGSEERGQYDTGDRTSLRRREHLAYGLVLVNVRDLWSITDTLIGIAVPSRDDRAACDAIGPVGGMVFG